MLFHLTFFRNVFHPIRIGIASLEVSDEFILSFGIAALLNRKVKGIAMYRTAFYLPSITTGVATAVLWYWVLQPNGLLNNFLNIFMVPMGIKPPNWLGSTTWAGGGTYF